MASFSRRCCGAALRGGAGVRAFAALALALAAVPLPVRAQTVGAPMTGDEATAPSRVESAPTTPVYGNLRYDDDLGYLRNPGHSPELWDPITYIPLGADPNAYLSFGGELRERFESYLHPNFGFAGAPQRNGYLLHRLLLHADLQGGEHFRAFVQLGDDQRLGKRGVPSTTDIDRLDVQQGFADLRLPVAAEGGPLLRVGRQEVLLGTQRLVAVREGPNVRRSFDGARLLGRIGGADVTALALRPVTVNPGVFDDRTNQQQALWGIYSTAVIAPPVFGDFYYLGFANDEARFGTLRGAEHRHSFGVRLFGAAGAWDWNDEAVGQIGSFKTREIRAWLVATDTGYTWAEPAWSPRLGFTANAASGDRNPQDGTLGTFNPLFPRLPYFAVTPLIVPANIYDARPTLTARPRRDVTVAIGWDFLWRQSVHDAIYGTAMSAFPRTGQVSGRRVGDEASLIVRWRPDPHVALGANYAHFNSGAAITEAGGKVMDYFVLSAAYRF